MVHKKDIMVAYACVECRKVFKKRKFTQDKSGHWFPVDFFDVKCPQCSELMYETGRAFKAPKSHNEKAWSKLKILFQSGYKFYPNRGNPFEDELPTKIKRAKLPQSEFRKPARKRNR